MNLKNVRIYKDGVKLNRACEKKIGKIVSGIQSFTPDVDLALRFLKSKDAYEVLLWGKVSDRPIGLYSSGPSVPQILDRIYGKSLRHCLKNLKTFKKSLDVRPRNNFPEPQTISL